MKKHIQSNIVSLELDGDLKTFCERLKSVEGIIDYARRGEYTVEITLESNTSTLNAIRMIMDLISACELELISINSSTSRIEDAFLKLLEEEEARGFLRAAKL